MAGTLLSIGTVYKDALKNGVHLSDKCKKGTRGPNNLLVYSHYIFPKYLSFCCLFAAYLALAMGFPVQVSSYMVSDLVLADWNRQEGQRIKTPNSSLGYRNYGLGR